MLVILGNPNKKSLGAALAKAYKEGAEKSGAEVKELILIDLNFDPVLRLGAETKQELEPDLIKSQELILWADHLVFVYPGWWATMPALLKGFLDRVFSSGFAFKYYGKGKIKKLLKGRSARVIMTMDTPAWFYRLFYDSCGFKAMKRGVLWFCGISPVRTMGIGPVYDSSDEKRKKWINKIKKIGECDYRRLK